MIKILRIRVDEDQYRMIVNRSAMLGYRTISQFIRDLALKDDLQSLKLIREIHEKVCEE
jgi:hypothetical protein